MKAFFKFVKSEEPIECCDLMLILKTLLSFKKLYNGELTVFCVNIKIQNFKL